MVVSPHLCTGSLEQINCRWIVPGRLKEPRVPWAMKEATAGGTAKEKEKKHRL